MARELVPFDHGSREKVLKTGAVVSTYDRTDRAQAMSLHRAMQNADKALDQMIGQKITIEHIVAHYLPTVDEETGEVRDAVRIVLVAPDGTRYSTRSQTAWHDLMRAVDVLEEPPPWNPPLAFWVRQVTARNGRNKYIQLELADMEGE